MVSNYYNRMQMQNEIALGTCQQCQPYQPNYNFHPNHPNVSQKVAGGDELDILELVSDIHPPNESQIQNTNPSNSHNKGSLEMAYQPLFDDLHNNSQYNSNTHKQVQLGEAAPSVQISKKRKQNRDPCKAKRKRSRFAQPETWPKNISKRKRMLGEEYIGFARSKDGTRRKVTRNKREMGPRCESKFCEKSGSRYCSMFDENMRQDLFQKFWNMTWEEKKEFVVESSAFVEKKRKYRKIDAKGPSRRNGSYQYYLPFQSKVYQVCKLTFLNTLGVREKAVHRWSNERLKLYFPKIPQSNQTTTEDGNTEIIEKTETRKLSKYEYLIKFLEDLPKIETYYSRKQIDSIYLEQDFRSKSEVYNFYKEKCDRDKMSPVTIHVFVEKFDDMNLNLFKPRKDQCDICSAYSSKLVDELNYQAHIARRDLSRKERATDKLKSEQNQIHCFDLDVQSVKFCPQLQKLLDKQNEINLEDRSRLRMYNFTIYNLATNDCMNYIWNETEAELSSSVFASFIIKYLESVLERLVQPIVLYSDSSGYRNKNLVLSNALSVLATKYGIEIEQKYLEKGHTLMESDSAHVLIEKRLKGKDIYLPTDFIGIIKDARKKPKPLDVEYVDHTFFKNYDEPRIMRYSSIQPQNKTKRKIYKIPDLSCLKYEADGSVLYKVNYNDSYTVLDGKQKPDLDLHYVKEELYNNRLKIWKSKWMYLQELKKSLPMDIRYFYDSIQFKDDKLVNLKSKKESTKTCKEKNS